ncbi:MAG: Gfo/Idh/MocA family oxidoreductase [Chloroflexi bacterium]|nr:Gfo/Idh/MocA family oxidoreductase [Chloroflexota bacterium]
MLQQRYRRLAIVDFKREAAERASSDLPDATVAGGLAELDAMPWSWDTTVGVIATWGPSHAAFFDELARRGVRRVLCEKPLANSVSAGAAMLKTADELGIILGCHHHFRYSGIIPGLTQLTGAAGLGEPRAMVVQGGAVGLVTNGIHYIDVACELFGRGPEHVVSSAVGLRINPRSPDLMFYGGTAAWSFGEGREATICFNNGASLAASVWIYYRDAVAKLSDRLDTVELCRRPADQVERFPAVTRVGAASEVVFNGPVPGLVSREERTIKQLAELETGIVQIFPPAQALEAVGSCIGALAAGAQGRVVPLPVKPDSEIGRTEWLIS